MADINISTNQLDAVAVSAKELSTNYDEIARDCFGMEGATWASYIRDRFPLTTWLLSTPMSRRMRGLAERGLINKRTDENGKIMLQIPRTLWTELPKSTENECCWVPFDFAKCAGEVPLNLLCLKDCDDILSTLVDKSTRLAAKDAIAPIANVGETVAQVNKRVARMSMAFFTAHTAILGLDNTYTNILKPFHGLLSVMENPAVMHIDGSSILAAFDELGCRMAVLGYNGFVFAAHPLVLDAMDRAIEPDRFGRLPRGWSRENGELRFRGARFIADPLVPFSVANGTGEIWMLSEDSVGLYMGTDLMPTDDFIEKGYTFAESTCGQKCTYYYNFGAAFGNNANKLAVIADVPVANACVNAIADIPGMVVPQTLIPNGEVVSA